MFLLGDMLARLYSAKCSNRHEVTILKSSFCIRIITILRDLGYISYSVIFDRTIVVYLKYKDNKAIFMGFKLISTPGRRIYLSLKQIKKINRKWPGYIICSTNKGLLTSIECEEYKIGGEIPFQIW
jgi:small subunit ribosomal protein S8